MKVIAPFEATRLSAAAVGDLIRLSHSQSPLGLIIHEENGKRVVGVLQDSAGVPPYHIVYQRDFACFRYTPGWVLELPREAAQFNASELSGKPGVVHLGPTGAVMNFAATDAMQHELTVNLSTFEWDDVGSHFAAFPMWRIWASEGEMMRPGATPILQFSAT